MSRKKIKEDDKRKTVSIRIPNDLIIHIESVKNKSKFFEWLLEEHFNNLNNEK